MTNSKTTKKALTASVITLVLCFLMLLGATFAWFTDTATTTVNKIQTGTLGVTIEQQTSDGKWESAENKTLNFVDANGNSLENIFWEPNATFNLPTLRVANNGNLALKYKATFSAVSGNTELAKVIDVFCNGTKVGTLSDLLNSTDADGFAHGNLGAGANSDELKVSLQMQESAGNTYQGMSIEGVVVTVYATQDTVESDSISNQYDKDATYRYCVYTLDELIAALSNSKEGTVVLMNDIEVTKQLVVPEKVVVTLDMNGKELYLADGVTDGSLDPMLEVKNGAFLTIDGDGAFDLGANPGFSFVAPRGDITINSGTFKIDTGLSSYGSFFIGITNGKGKLIINGGYFDGGYYVEDDCFNNCRSLLNASWEQYIRVYGGTFVAQNPAWGDEGMTYLCPCCTHPREGEYCQGVFLEGQNWQDTTLPADYKITEGTTDDGRPTYTVTYSQP